jgi:hypothetical protein
MFSIGLQRSNKNNLKLFVHVTLWHPSTFQSEQFVHFWLPLDMNLKFGHRVSPLGFCRCIVWIIKIIANRKISVYVHGFYVNYVGNQPVDTWSGALMK